MTDSLPPAPGARVRVASPGHVMLEGDLGFDTVTEVRPALAAALDRAAGQSGGGGGSGTRRVEPVVVDLGGVQRADSAGLALLVAAMRRARERGITLRFEDVPLQLRQMARVCGLAGPLGIGGGDAKHGSTSDG